MKKFINVSVILILLFISVFWALKLSDRNSALSIVDLAYDQYLTELENEYFKTLNEASNIDTKNRKENTEKHLPKDDEEDISGSDWEVDRIFEASEFFEAYGLALERYNNWQNTSQVYKGTVTCEGYGAGQKVMTIKNSGFHFGQMKNSAGERFMSFGFNNVNIDVFGMQVRGEKFLNEYRYSYPMYSISQYGLKKNISASAFAKEYKHEIDNIIFDIDEKNTRVEAFMYDQYAEMYTAKLTIIDFSGVKRLSGLLTGMAQNPYTNDFSINIVQNNSIQTSVMIKFSKNLFLNNMQVVQRLNASGYASVKKYVGFDVAATADAALNYIASFNYHPAYYSVTDYVDDANLKAFK